MSIVRFIAVHCGEGEWSNTSTPHLLLTAQGRRQNRQALDLVLSAINGQPRPVASLTTPLEHARQTRPFLEVGLGMVVVDGFLARAMPELAFPYPLQELERNVLEAVNASTTSQQLCRASEWVHDHAVRIRNEFILCAAQLANYLGQPQGFSALVVVQDCLPGLLIQTERLMCPGDVMVFDVNTRTGSLIPGHTRIFRAP